jgi:transcriptional regulator with XRE-family HTH domain
MTGSRSRFPAPTSTIRGREIGRLLRNAQERAYVTGDHLAATINVSPAKMSRILNGRVLPGQVEVAALLTACGVSGETFEQVTDLCHPRHEPGSLWLGLAAQWSAYLAHTADADRLIEYEPSMVPWLAQTPEYTKSLPDVVTGKLIDRGRAVELLALPHVDLLLTEWALRSEVGDRWQMQNQLRHLLRLSASPGLTIRIIPADRSGHLGLSAFSLVDFLDQPMFVHREELTAGLFADEPSEVLQYRIAADHLVSLALVVEESHDLIGRMAARYGGPIPPRPATIDVRK